MRQQINVMSLLFVFSFAVLTSHFVSCSSGSDKSSMIAKKWKVKDMKMGDRELTDKQKKQMKMMLNRIKKNSQFHFKSDGNYEITWMGQSEKGTWKLKDDGKQLVTTEKGGGKEQKSKIEELSKNKLVMTQSGQRGKTKIVLVPKK